MIDVRRFLFDWVLIPSAIVGLAFEPNFANGWVDYLEAGQYLGPIAGIFHGEVPYRDSVTVFGPLFLYVPAAFMALFGKTLAVLRLHFHALAIANVLVGYAVGRLVCRRPFFRCLVPFLFLLEAYHPFWSTRWGGLRIGIGLLALGRLAQYVRHERRRDLALAGFLAGFGLFYSIDVGSTVLVTAGALACWLGVSGTRTAHAIARDLAAFAVGFAVAAVPFLAFMAGRGALRPYLRVAFWELPLHQWALSQRDAPSLLAAYGQAESLAGFLAGGAVKVYLPALLYGLCLAFLAIRFLTGTVTRDVTVTFPFVVYGSLTYAAAFRAILGPQFQMALPPLLIVICAYLERRFEVLREAMERWRAGRRLDRVGVTVSALVLVVAALYVVASEKRYYRSLAGWAWYQLHKSDASALYGGPAPVAQMDWVRLTCSRCGGIRVPRFQAQELDGVTAFLRQHTAPGEVVFGFPEHTIFNFLADRRSPSRFHIAGFASIVPAWRGELLGALEREPPRIAVVGRFLSNEARALGRKEELLPEVREYLRAHYRVVGIFPTVIVLERPRSP